jgi:hypothetical protein
VFPDVLLSNAYTILRPFFRLVPGASDPNDANSWELDLDSSSFPGMRLEENIAGFILKLSPGIMPREGGYMGPRPTPAMHPNLALEKTMVSVPHVRPGDMVFWHCVSRPLDIRPR